MSDPEEPKSASEGDDKAAVEKAQQTLDKRIERIQPWQWKPGQSGNPGGRPTWMKDVRRLIAHKQDEMFNVLANLASGRIVELKEPDGRPAHVRSTGGEKRRVLRIVPTGEIVVRAFTALMDRAYGRPAQAVLVRDETELGGGALGAAYGADDLSDEERAVLLRVARRRAMAAGRARLAAEEAEREVLDVTPESDEGDDGD
jgi:hypothetical protein